MRRLIQWWRSLAIRLMHPELFKCRFAKNSAVTNELHEVRSSDNVRKPTAAALRGNLRLINGGKSGTIQGSGNAGGTGPADRS